MLKTIFAKLLITYVSVIIFVSLIVSILFSIFFTRYVVDDKRNILESTTVKVNDTMTKFYKSEINNEQLSTTLDSLGNITNSRIFIVNINSDFIKNPSQNAIGEGLDEAFIVSDIIDISKGKKVFRQKQYSKKFDIDVIFVGAPLVIDNSIKGAILIFSPETNLKKSISDMNYIIIIVTIVALILGAIITFITSRRISIPLSRIEYFAKKIAEGHNIPDICIKSKDEIGSLANTFNYMKRKLQDTEKMRREFIANVSHDLRSPLTSINGFVISMIDGRAKVENYPKYLNIIQEETTRLIKLTGEITKIAKLESDGIELSKEYINVKSLLDDIFFSLTDSILEKNITYKLECSDETQIYADYDKFKQIIINLISNAIKYNKESGDISVNIFNSRNTSTISIKDTGIGISMEHIPFIFEKFYRVDKSRQSSQNSFGLGLSIVKTLIELHGGNIIVESQPDLGTQVIINLPISNDNNYI